MTPTQTAGSMGRVAVFVCGLVIGACGGGAAEPEFGSGDPSATSSGRTTPCRAEDPPTAGNRVTWFLGDVVQGRHPLIQGGVDDPFGCAYAQLCSAIRGQVSEAQFRASRAGAVSSVLTADTWALVRTGPSDYTPGVDEERPDMETLDPGGMSTWKDVEFTWYEHIDDRMIVIDSGRTERWRVDLVREDGNWRVCDFQKRES